MKADLKITRKMVAAVRDDACFSCGRHSYEPCPRATDSVCAREFHGGSRKPTAKIVTLPVIRVEKY